MTNEQAARAIYEQVFDRGNMRVLEQVMSEHYIQHEGSGQGDRASFGMFTAWPQQLRRSFPDLRFEVVASSVDTTGDVWLHARFTGTQLGEYAGIAPTGKAIEVNMLDRLKFRDGKVVEHWGATDFTSLMRQLGAAVPW